MEREEPPWPSPSVVSPVSVFFWENGMASGLETLCGQAYGAEQYQKFGMQIHTTAIFSLLLMCVPLAMIWFNMERILIFIVQDPLISHKVGKFTIWRVPGLFAYAIQQPFLRYLNDSDVVEYVIALTPLVCLSVILDGLQGALSGKVKSNTLS
ncbi:hypothetical protein PIB30_074371 [Stylosanthes scabra]|uniref:Uncharacterized protein n=1 Tax=Stylosanthes scabra TaxID=79078 RepID=A0ABU6QPR8_9FABA|nr:hypothetical protein [Stylosanthes scabra]